MLSNLTEFLFSTEGRISRSQFWLKCVLSFIVLFAIWTTIFLVFAARIAFSSINMPKLVLVYFLMFLFFFLITAWPFTVVLVKRMHDRNKSGWLVLAYWIPAAFQIIFPVHNLFATARHDTSAASTSVDLINLFATTRHGQDTSDLSTIVDLIVFAVMAWFFIEFGCMRGTNGANQYGPDPVA